MALTPRRTSGAKAFPALAYSANAAKLCVPTRNVVLTNEQERLVQSLVTSGRYQNASEVVREGLRLIERREAEYEARLDALRAAAGAGVAALDRGDFKEFSDTRSLNIYLDGLADKVLRRGATRR